MKNRIMLIGLGPHAKRIYINLFKRHNIIPTLIVDLEDNKNEIIEYLQEHFDTRINCYFVKNEEADLLELSLEVKNDLKELIKKLNINYAIISTEPKSHFAYSKFLIENNIKF